MAMNVESDNKPMRCSELFLACLKSFKRTGLFAKLISAIFFWIKLGICKIDFPANVVCPISELPKLFLSGKPTN